MVCANDIVLVGESRKEINEKLDLWREALKANDFHISRSKIEYIGASLARDAQILT